jgi:uncharacterized phage protein (TIGR01671 family)
MNREIKFRAWDSTSMKSWEKIALEFEFDTSKGKDHFGLKEYFDFMLDNEIAVMQFTGIKDKHGVDIYEGDMVEQRNFIGEVIGLYEIRWGQFGFTMFDPKEPDVTSRYVSPTLLSVVGNIYEAGGQA